MLLFEPFDVWFDTYDLFENLNCRQILLSWWVLENFLKSTTKLYMDLMIQPCFMERKMFPLVKWSFRSFLSGFQDAICLQRALVVQCLALIGDGTTNTVCQSTVVWHHFSRLLLDSLLSFISWTIAASAVTSKSTPQKINPLTLFLLTCCNGAFGALSSGCVYVYAGYLFCSARFHGIRVNL